MTSPTPQRTRQYKNEAIDTDRWQGFVPRGDDIFVCTSYKAGTTWMQTLCALLIFQRPEPPAPLARLSPWLELIARPIEEVLGLYEAQTHRRFIKSHTPLDGIPFFEHATYLYCGRDPRDVFLSLQNHFDNTDYEVMAKRRAARGLEPVVRTPTDQRPSLDAMFEAWLTVPGFPWEQDGFPLWSHFGHARSFWDYRHLDNIHLLHYRDLETDLEGQMRRLARILGIEVDESLWPGLVEGATFAAVKARPDLYAPEADLGMWKDNARFFHQGTSGRGRQALSEQSLALYERVKLERVSPALADWLERGSIACGDPGRVA